MERRERAREAFFAVYLAGFVLGLLGAVVEPPEPVRVAVAVLWIAAAVVTAGAWLAYATADGSLRRALPDYLYAAFGLAVIALACAGAAAAVLLLLGEPVTVDRVTGWAAIGTAAVLLAYWLRRALASR